MKKKLVSKLACSLVFSVAAFLATAPAAADWFDGFESYPNGTLLNNVGGWGGWGNSAASAGTATNAFAHTGSNSIVVAGPSGDAVHPFTPGEYSAGIIQVEAWMLLNQSSHTANTYFIVNNAYVNNGGAGTAWATQLLFSTNGTVAATNGAAGGNGTAAINYDAWTQIRILYDLTNDVQTTFYNNALMSTGTVRNGAEPLEIANIDLYQEGTATNITYYDNISVSVVPEPSAGCIAIALFGGFLFRRRKE